MEKRIYRVYRKTVSIVNETAITMYRNLVGDRTGFLLESYDRTMTDLPLWERSQKK